MEQRLCVSCDTGSLKFRDNLSIQEYYISRMCQSCQDKVFGVCGPDNEECDHDTGEKTI